MALPRKDIRAWFDADIHEAIAGEASDDGLKLGEWVEQLVLRELESRARQYAESIRRHERLRRLGVSRIRPENTGRSRSDEEGGGR